MKRVAGLVHHTLIFRVAVKQVGSGKLGNDAGSQEIKKPCWIFFPNKKVGDLSSNFDDANTF